jgi:hypothetical protein
MNLSRLNAAFAFGSTFAFFKTQKRKNAKELPSHRTERITLLQT